MDKLVIEGGQSLKGEVTVSGSKNSALPILAATLLSSEDCYIENVPDLLDIVTMIKILRVLGRDVERLADGTIVSKPRDETPVMAPHDLVKTMRASIATLGPLVARRGMAKVSLPGGCVIGARPIDLHLKGMQALGAEVRMEHGYVITEAKELRGAEIYLGGAFGPSVLGTGNVMMAASLAHGVTVIENAACEPEVTDLANFINAMGGAIKGAGSHHIEIIGVRRLGGARYRVIPDRIEAGTFMVAAAITNGNVLIKDMRNDHLAAVTHMLQQTGAKVEKSHNSCRVIGQGRPKAVHLTTNPYPGFPTDLQAQFMSLFAISTGVSIVSEKIYPDRFMHVGELNRLGAMIFREGDKAFVTGVERLSGAEIMASDLRASAALVLAGLVAEGKTTVERVYHIDRGYEKIEEKLKGLGAKITRVAGKEVGVPDFSPGE